MCVLFKESVDNSGRVYLLKFREIKNARRNIFVSAVLVPKVLFPFPGPSKHFEKNSTKAEANY